jgi:hypothetical protein
MKARASVVKPLNDDYYYLKGGSLAVCRDVELSYIEKRA